MGNCLKPLKEQPPPPPPSISPKPLIISPVESEKENLREFSFAKLSNATKKFRQYKIIKGNDNGCCIRTFYHGYINETTFAPSKTGIAVSVMECYQDSSQTLQDWKEEVKYLGRLSHPNLVKLLGYCCQDNKSFLVFEYLHKGSLDSHIFGKEEQEALPWEIRVKIAIGAAQSIAFLHSVNNSSLYRELRMYNILLDEHFNTKLFHLGSKRVGLLEGTAFIGRTVYIAPEYIISGHLGTKSDVYTFGVILFEILTGLKASDCKHNENMQSLHVWTKPFLSDQSKMREIIDPRLGNDYPVNAATQMGKLIKRCIKLDTSKRPSMQQVLDRLNDIAEIKD
ncbi:PREDICTED: putative inactive serine/threonine-protein kinase At5g11400 [Camelina sativa]|uniref:Inactive serine/threonine-protein kinase At5g11400 n=1 Tax=Camelina sativa TaxID=90675 RepID=A0ABM1RFL0_CAMSA|nr:PREDICTED: putative inactive serine/threonine-protein kinase At5g11400 [Camelina sativa]XP_019097798.1 PREDICTED: putative inactive serine/threonine-protein kinase At5g11400 [Camelina sativa]